jgi:hypothetical protein
LSRLQEAATRRISRKLAKTGIHARVPNNESEVNGNVPTNPIMPMKMPVTPPALLDCEIQFPASMSTALNTMINTLRIPSFTEPKESMTASGPGKVDTFAGSNPVAEEKDWLRKAAESAMTPMIVANVP